LPYPNASERDWRAGMKATREALTIKLKEIERGLGTGAGTGLGIGAEAPSDDVSNLSDDELKAIMSGGR
jgi:hypothetical protein